MLTAETIERALQSHYTERANETRDSFPISGSSFGHCPRRLSSLVAGVGRVPLSYKAGRVFEDGHDRGRALAAAFERLVPEDHLIQHELPVWCPIPGVHDVSKAVAEIQRRFPSDLGIVAVHGGVLCLRGRIDTCLFEERDGKLHADTIEIKGKNSFGMTKLDSEGPGHEYLAQVAFYRKALQFGMGFDKPVVVDSCHFLFEDKDTQEWKILRLDQEELETLYLSSARAVADIINRMADLGSLFTGTEGTPLIPAGFEGKLPWQCNYCVVGPKTGQCCPGKILIDNRKPGKLVPAWEAR